MIYLLLFILFLTHIFLFFEIWEISFHFYKEDKAYIFEVRRKIDWVDAKISFYFYKSNETYAAYPKWYSKYRLNILKINKSNLCSSRFDSLLWLVENKKARKNLLIAAFISFLFYIINMLTNNWFYIFIQKSLMFQTIIIFLTIITFINLFTFAGFKEPISNTKVKKIIKDTTQEIERNDKNKKRLEKRFTV